MITLHYKIIQSKHKKIKNICHMEVFCSCTNLSAMNELQFHKMTHASYMDEDQIQYGIQLTWYRLIQNQTQ